MLGGVAGYAWFIPVRAADPTLLRALVPAAPAGYVTRPTGATPVSPSKTGLAAVRAAAATTPGATGAYSVQWRRPGSTTAPAEVLVAVLPSASEASTAGRQAVQRYLGRSALKSSGASSGVRFRVAAGGGAPAAVFVTAASSSSPESATAVAVLRHGRAVAVVLAAAPGTAAASTARTRLATVAADESRVLARAEPGLTLARTTFPVTASAVYGGAAVALVVLLYAVPAAVDRARTRRHAARARAAERARRARGRKVVRRQSGVTVRRR